MTSPALADPRLIVGLDLPSLEAAEALVDRLGDVVLAYKVGLTLLARPGGVAFAHKLRARGRGGLVSHCLLPAAICGARARSS